jgi:ribose/xylose/arabinose/galactoside ABC-type transport system permease subunit
MKETFNKIGYYILLPLIIITILLELLYQQFHDFEKSLNLTSTLIQTLAILIVAFGLTINLIGKNELKVQSKSKVC